MNPLRLQLLRDFAAEVGPALCDLNVAAASFAREWKAGPSEQAKPEWSNLIMASGELHLRMQGWGGFGLILDDLLSRDHYPEHRPLWEAALALYQKPMAEQTEEEQKALFDRLRDAAVTFGDE